MSTIGPGAGEQRAVPPPVSKEVMIGSAAPTRVTTEAKEKAEAWLLAVRGSKDASSEARRALSAVGSERKASWDGKNPSEIIDRINDPNIKDRAKVQIEGAQVTMGAIDVFRLPATEQQARIDALKVQGKLPSTITTPADLKNLAITHIVSNSFFSEYFNDLPTGTSKADIAEELFLQGPLADIVQLSLSEQVGLIDQATLALPLVPVGETEKLKAKAKQAEDLSTLAKIGIRDEVAARTSKVPTTDQENKLAAAAMTENESERKVAIAKVVAEVDGMTDADYKLVEAHKSIERDLATKKAELARTTDVARQGVLNGDITVLEGHATTFRGSSQALIDQFDRAQNIAGNATMKVLAETYGTQHKNAVIDNLRVQAAVGSTEPVTDEARKRVTAEQTLAKQIDMATAKALDEAIENRINDLSAGGLKLEEENIEKARKAGDEELAKRITAYKDSLRHGDKAFFITEEKKDKTGKVIGKVETVRIDNLTNAMRVIAVNDTADGNDGTNFMVAYHAGLYDTLPPFVATTAKPTETPAEVAVRAQHAKLATLAQEVLIGSKSAAVALGELDADGQKSLKQFCTPERVQGFTKHLFAEYSRAERYVKGDGIFGWGNKIKGIEVKFEGDKKNIDLMTNYWDQIFGIHDQQIMDSIRADEKALKFAEKLRGKNWISGDRKAKKWLYGILLILGLIAAPVGGMAFGPGAVAAVGGAGFGAKKIGENIIDANL